MPTIGRGSSQLVELVVNVASSTTTSTAEDTRLLEDAGIGFKAEHTVPKLVTKHTKPTMDLEHTKPMFVARAD